MKQFNELRILDKFNKVIESIARGNEPTVRCDPTFSAVTYIRFSFVFLHILIKSLS